MIRNAKILGLALVAMLAMSAIAASAASATAFDAPSGLTKITASQEANFEHTVGVTFGSITCEKVTFVGEASGNGLASGEVIPNYTNCLVAGIAATVDTNGCNYKLFATGTMNIVCPEGKEITATAPASPSTAKCTLHIPAQTGLGKVTYANIGASSPTKKSQLPSMSPESNTPRQKARVWVSVRQQMVRRPEPTRARPWPQVRTRPGRLIQT